MFSFDEIKIIRRELWRLRKININRLTLNYLLTNRVFISVIKVGILPTLSSAFTRTFRTQFINLSYMVPGGCWRCMLCAVNPMMIGSELHQGDNLTRWIVLFIMKSALVMCEFENLVDVVPAIGYTTGV